MLKKMCENIEFTVGVGKTEIFFVMLKWIKMMKKYPFSCKVILLYTVKFSAVLETIFSKFSYSLKIMFRT